MVNQRPVSKVTKAKIRKNVKTSEKVSKENVKELAGPREAVALEVLHAMFMKKLAQKSNFAAFQKKKSYVDKQLLKVGAKEAFSECFENNEIEDEAYSDASD